VLVDDFGVSRLSLAIVCAASLLVVAGGTAAQLTATGPPPELSRSLTPNGRVLWNLDALLNDTFGNRVDCYDGQRIVLFSVPHGGYCPAPQARYQTYVFTFLNANHSEFRLVRLARAPDTGATNAPVRVGSRFVSCPDGQYHHSGRGWLVFGGGAGPTGLFWCN
jgi:hypothetical protein